MISTHEICTKLYSDPVLALMIPQRSCRSLPVPSLRKGIPIVGCYFYLIEGDAGKSKRIFPPIARVFIDKRTGKVVDICLAPLFWEPGHRTETSVGEYPGHGTKGLSVIEKDKLVQDYFSYVDQLLADTYGSKSFPKDERYRRWLESFHRLKENGLDAYYEQLAGFNLASSTLLNQPVVQEPITTDIVDANTDVEKPSATVDLEAVVTKTRRIIAEAGVENLKSNLDRIVATMLNRQFLVAVVGEFGRGKSTLVNQLLEIDLLPANPTPTTALLTQITFGQTTRAQLIKTDGAMINIDLDTMSEEGFWDSTDIAATDGLLRVEVDNPLLKRGAFQIIDTPGVGDPIGERADIAMATIARCDATLLVVNATMPLSLTEMNFIEDHIRSIRRPRAAVVVTHLDRIRSDERPMVIKNIKHRLEQRFSGIPLWCAFDGLTESEQSFFEVHDLNGIREKLTAWALDPNHRILRKQFLKAMVNELLERLVRTLKARRESIMAQVAAQKSDQKVMEAKRSALELRWQDLRIELEKRQLSFERQFSDDLENRREAWLEGLQLQLRQTQNPKNWWETTLPYRLKTDTKQLHSRIEQDIRTRLQADEEWLRGQIQAIFDVDSSLSRVQMARSKTENNNQTLSIDVDDINRLRLISRIGTASLTLSGFLFPPLSAVLIAGSIAGGVSMEIFLSNRIEQQKQTLSEKLHKLIDKMFDDSIGTVLTTIRQSYAALKQQLDEEERLWGDATSSDTANDQAGVAKELTFVDAFISDTEHLMSQMIE